MKLNEVMKRIFEIAFKVLCKFGKWFLWFVWVLISLILLSLVVNELNYYMFPTSMMASKNLGDGIYLREFHARSRYVLLGDDVRRYRVCNDGKALIPKHFGRGDFVVEANADDKWIIVKMYNDSIGQNEYYIVDKEKFNDVRRNAIFDHYDSIFFFLPDCETFVNECQNRGIELNF